MKINNNNFYKNILYLSIFFLNSCIQINNVELDSVSNIQKKSHNNNQQLKVLSWNIKMHPAPISWFINCEERAKAISHLLKNIDPYDIIFFQEAFSSKIRKNIYKELNTIYPYQIEPNDKKNFFKINSGLWAISQFPIKLKNHLSFSDFRDSDGFASKGAKLFSFNKNGTIFNFINTHLQSDYNKSFSEIRSQQYLEIYNKLILPNENGEIFILIGDLNISKPKKLKKMLQKIKFSNGPILGNLQHSIVGSSKKIVDYILIKDDKNFFKSINRKIINFADELNGEKYNFSDHYPIEAKFMW